jgi:crotonobetainyl-CoA:carnitine CoA-transferase CaiB-like acyl-CoA transferase
VLDLTRVIAGPVATRYLSALGADVLRLDPPDRPELTLHAYDGLFGKRSALLDFGTADGRARLDSLLTGADVLVHGYRPHALDRFGLNPQTLAERHPGLVVVGLSARAAAAGRRWALDPVQAASGRRQMAESARRRAARRAAASPDHGTGTRARRRAAGAGPAAPPGGGTQFR